MVERGLGDRVKLGQRRCRRRQRLDCALREQLELAGLACRLDRLGLFAVPVEADLHERIGADELERSAVCGCELLGGIETLEHPAHRRRAVRRALTVDRAGDDQPVDGARHRDVVEAESLRAIFLLARPPHLFVVERRTSLARRGVGDLEAEPTVRQREDLVAVGRTLVAARVGNDHDLELEPLRRVDGEQPHGIRALLLRNRLELLGADGFLVADEADEAFQVRAAQLLVRAREPRELAQVRVAAAAVPLREHGEVVVVLGDDLLAETLERQARQCPDEPLVALEERADQLRVAFVELGRQALLDSREERPLRRGASDQHERVVRDADERRREHGDERLVVVAVLQQQHVREEVHDLLLAEVPAAGRAIRRQARLPQLLLVRVRVGARSEKQHDLARCRRSLVDELANAARDVLRLRAPPVHARVRVRLLLGDQELDGVAEDGVRELAGGSERLEAVAELVLEQVVDRREHLGARAVVADEREPAALRLPPLAEDLHVRVPEPVDRLELVADEEELRPGRTVGDEVDQLALEPVRVLELVDHDRREAQVLALADPLVRAEEVARVELQVLEVEHPLAPLRRFVRACEAFEQRLEQVAVANRELVERRLLDDLARLLVRRGALAAAHLVRGEVEQAVRGRRACEEVEHPRSVRALELGRARVGGEAARRVAERLDPLGERCPLAELEHELAACRAQRLVHADQHPAQCSGPVRREQLQALRLLAGAELVERLRERLAGEHGRLRAVELAEARVEPRLERVGAKQARAEAVDGRDPGAVELAREVVASALAQLAPDARTQLTRGLARVRDHEDRADVDPAVADRADEPLDEHGGLAGAGARREEDATVGLDRCLLLRVRGERAHGRRILHIGQSWHHCGHSPPRGSCRTSPARMRCASPRALSRAVSTWRQNASSST